MDTFRLSPLKGKKEGVMKLGEESGGGEKAESRSSLQNTLPLTPGLFLLHFPASHP